MELCKNLLLLGQDVTDNFELVLNVEDLDKQACLLGKAKEFVRQVGLCVFVHDPLAIGELPDEVFKLFEASGLALSLDLVSISQIEVGTSPVVFTRQKMYLPRP